MKVIHINQLGYRPHDRKSAAITAEAEAFRVVRAADGAIAWVGQTSEAAYDTASGENVCHADFSGLTEKGEYFVSAAGEASYPFVIADEPYKALKKALRDFFHYQRCGMDLECGTWSHLACHTKLAKVYGSAETKDVRGGWHDAGDYGRYVVPATMAVADLLLAHELTAGSAAADLVVPEIVRYELDWLLKMQDERSGGVYHKVSCKNFDAFDEMPEDEQEPLYLCPMSLSATADFAATMALSARFYPHRKDELLDAAKRAWKWCQAHHDMPPFENPPDITTGPYGNRFATDEFCENGRFWAACELFAATGAEQYHEYIRRSELYAGLGWGDMGG
jgi:endoglucanase